jgi:heavy metal efflux system protein
MFLMNTKAPGRFNFLFSSLDFSGIFTLLKKIHLILPFYLVSLTSPLLSQKQDTMVLTLNEAVAIALNNNYLLKNASLRIDQLTQSNLAGFNLPATELNYRFGQLYSEENTKYLEINQNFGSILTHIREMKRSGFRNALASDELELVKADLSAQVKSAYFSWVFSFAISGIYEEEKNLFSKLTEIAALRYQLGEISILDKTISLTHVSEVEGLYLNSLDDIAIAENKLRLLLQDTHSYVPESFVPELYQIQKASDTSTYSGNRYLEYYSDQYNLARINQSIAGSRYFPEINAGIITQDITGLNQLYGGQIGLAIPLWIPGNQADIKKARMNTEIALNELDYQKKKNTIEVENLLLELNKCFRQIRHFEVNALPQAELLISNALSQLDSEEIDYMQFLESITAATKIKLDYYMAILKYNQTAIQIELYVD